jgi:hypothetical protein
MDNLQIDSDDEDEEPSKKKASKKSDMDDKSSVLKGENPSSSSVNGEYGTDTGSKDQKGDVSPKDVTEK